MQPLFHIIDIVFLVISSLFLSMLCLTSFFEKEFRAVWISFGSLILNLIFWSWLIFSYNSSTAVLGLNILVIAGVILFAVISLLRFFPAQSPIRDVSLAIPYDERDNMFARNNLKNHPDLMEAYYKNNPEKVSIDNQIHNKPDFGNPVQVYHNDDFAPVYGAAFEYLEKTIPASMGTPAADKRPIDPFKFCQTVKEMVRFYGGCDVGFLGL
ncbi:MAG: hypothetical protein GY729_20305, partial [Desulfobacteraceae bacterium]|nr:hypothetical protein [Desulfobacteraceae bacterium]